MSVYTPDGFEEVATKPPKPLTVESAMRELQELLPRWRYFAITESVGAPRKRYWLKFGPAFYSADVMNVWGDTLDEAMNQVRKWTTTPQ